MPRWVRVARTVHRVIALVIGLHFVLIATTGALFIFEQELTQWAQARRGWAATDGDVGPDACVEEIARAWPQWDGSYLVYPRADMPFYTAYIGTESDVFWTDVFVDPGSGEIVGAVDNSSFCIEGILQVAIQLHIRLCAGELGRQLVDASVALFVVEILTGLLLWWPGSKRLHRAFRLRFNRSRFLWLFDVHRFAGVLAAVPLLLMALTGLLWGYPRILVPVVYWCCGESAPTDAAAYREHVQSAPPEALPAGASPRSLADLVQVVRKEYQPDAIESLYLEAPQGRELTVQTTRRLDANEEAVAQTVRIDRLTAAIVEPPAPDRSPSLADRLTDEWAHKLHYGTFGGLTTKLLYLFACLCVDLLFVTGVSMWIIKSRKKRLRRC